MFDPSLVHFFDANYGEYLLTRTEFPIFLADWGRASLYEKKDVIQSYQVVNIPVWWGKGTAEHPFIHELPDSDPVDMMTW